MTHDSGPGAILYSADVWTHVTWISGGIPPHPGLKSVRMNTVRLTRKAALP